MAASGTPKSSNSKTLTRRPQRHEFKNPNRIPVGKNRAKTKKETKKNVKKSDAEPRLLSEATAAQQLHFFLDRYQLANGIKLSAIELEGFKETCFVELRQGLKQDDANLSKHMKAIFGASWNDVLCDGQLLEEKVEAGSPAVLIIASSAIRSLELLRGLRPLTRECQAAKLFSKHMKVDEQVSLLKSRVNIASGTPSRIKKLIDMDALGLSRLAVIILDMHTDVKGYSLLTLPQVSGEFWDLYKTHFQQQLLQGDQRVCLYGPIVSNDVRDSEPSIDGF